MMMMAFCWSCVKMKINRHTINSIRKFRCTFCVHIFLLMLLYCEFWPASRRRTIWGRWGRQKVLRARAPTFSLENELVMQLMLISVVVGRTSKTGHKDSYCGICNMNRWAHFAFKNELSNKTEIKEYLTFFWFEEYIYRSNEWMRWNASTDQRFNWMEEELINLSRSSNSGSVTDSFHIVTGNWNRRDFIYNKISPTTQFQLIDHRPYRSIYSINSIVGIINYTG